MSRLVLLDSGPLGLASNAGGKGLAGLCSAWLDGLIDAGVRVMVPAIADYEVRRELLRVGKPRATERLDALVLTLGYLPLRTDVMMLAAQLWAEARRGGYPTAANAALDGDVILAAQALVAAKADGWDVTIATNNVGHLARFAPAAPWEHITA